MSTHATLLRGALLACLGAVVLLAGCASTAPKPTYTQNIEAGTFVSAPDTVDIKVMAGPGVELIASDKARILELTNASISKRKATILREGEPRAYVLELNISRYEKGSKFARFMLAGLGQIHLDGTGTLLMQPDNTKVGQFDLKKTFAWGGVYGGSTTIEDMVPVFAEGVAAAVTGQNEQPKKAKK